MTSYLRGGRKVERKRIKNMRLLLFPQWASRALLPALSTLITFSFKFSSIVLGVQGQRQGKNNEKVNYGKEASDGKLKAVP